LLRADVAIAASAFELRPPTANLQQKYLAGFVRNSGGHATTHSQEIEVLAMRQPIGNVYQRASMALLLHGLTVDSDLIDDSVHFRPRGSRYGDG